MTKHKNNFVTKSVSEKNNISYEEAFDRLKVIVDKMQDEQITLEETVNLYKEGKNLTEHCNKLLELAKFEIEEIADNDETKK